MDLETVSELDNQHAAKMVWGVKVSHIYIYIYSSPIDGLGMVCVGPKILSYRMHRRWTFFLLGRDLFKLRGQGSQFRGVKDPKKRGQRIAELYQRDHFSVLCRSKEKVVS